LKQIDIRIANVENEETTSEPSSSDLKAFGGKLKIALIEIWKDRSTDVFDARFVSQAISWILLISYDSSDVDLARIDDLAEMLGSLQGMRHLFQPILNVILSALDAPPVFMRTKALRALGQIVTSDPEILSAVYISLHTVHNEVVLNYDPAQCSKRH
jgi:cohesin loading factor subunit SCC2